MSKEEVNKPLDPVLRLLDLARKARRAESSEALQFMLVNQTTLLVPYLVSVFWVEHEGVVIQSGVSHVEKHSPFVQKVNQICEGFKHQTEVTVVNASMLNPEQVADWSELLPDDALWIPIQGYQARAGLLMTRERPFSEQEIALITEWIDIWTFAWLKIVTPSLQSHFKRWLLRLSGHAPVIEETDDRRENSRQPKIGFFKKVQLALLNKRNRWKMIVVLVLLVPVRLTVLAPGEVIPLNPAVIRVPIEGVVDEFYVAPNDHVVAGQPLLSLDQTSLQSRLQIAQQEIQIATQEYRQSALQSLADSKSRSQLAAQEGKAAERKIEAEYLKSILEKAKIVAPRDGIVIFDDPSEWIGKPVIAGEKVMSVATQGQVQIEAWVPVGDVLEVEKGASVTLFLNATPFSPVAGQLKYFAHEPIQRPDGTYAYRVRAILNPDVKAPRIGLKGTVKISGDYVPMFYWILRKPIASLRQFTGI